jgi:hypothetical protein
LIKGKKSRDGKSINLIDLTFFPLETVLTQCAFLPCHESIFHVIAAKQHQEIPDDSIIGGWRSTAAAVCLCSVDY